MFEKPQNLQKNFRLPNLHNKGYEPVSQSSLSLYTSKSNGHHERRQHFQFGKTACGSATNALIYGSGHPLGQLDVSGIKSKVQANKKPEKIEKTNKNTFIYGKNDHTNEQPRQRNSNIFSLGEKTSAELRKKMREVKERENDYNEYLQQKELQAQIRDEEKRKDLDMLKMYKQPWGKPGGGAPTSDTHRSKEIHHLIDHKEQVLPLGKPGGGAPLRSDSGSLKAAIGLDPEIQFQKRHREQIHNVIMPSNKTKRNYEYLTELDILAQKTREQRNVIVRDKDFSSTIYDPFGRPGAGAPIYDNNGKTKAARSKKLLQDVQGDTSKHQLKDASLPYGTPRFKRPVEDTNEFQGFAAGFGKGGAGAPIVDKDGNVITTKRQTLVKSDDSAIIKCDEEPIDNASYNPWGRHGGGAPIRDQQGNLVTQVGGRWKSDQIAASPKQRQQVEAKKMYLESLRSQAREHEEWKQIERDSLKQPSNDTTSWLKRGVVGKPPYDENTREIVGAHRVTSDIVKQRLQKQVQHKERGGVGGGDWNEELSAQHAQPMDGIWGNFGTDAPKGNPRRQKVDVAATQFLTHK